MIKYYCQNCNINVNSSECPVCKSRTRVDSMLFWCEECNIPVYDEYCPICGTKAKEFTPDARPVFPEERLLIEIILGAPLKFINDSVWNGSGNNYYVNGKRLPLSISKLNDLDPELVRAELTRYESKNSYQAFDSLMSKWKLANERRFHDITTEARQFIIEKHNQTVKTEVPSVIVSFSGGKDSTVVSDLVRKALGNPSIIHIFGNTTLEFPQTYDYIKRFKDENRKTPVLKAENRQQDFFNLCNYFGPPSRSLRWCCTVFKTGFIDNKIKSTFDKQKNILTFYGIRRSESTSRSNYERSSIGRKISNQVVASPIIDWFDHDIWLYIISSGIDFNSAYRLGYTRVGCWCCPNNSKWSQFLASVYMPEQTARFNDILLAFAKKMGKTDPEEYVKNGGWKARQGGAGIDMSKNVAIEFTPCATDELSFNYELSKPISDQLYELFKPFGVLNFEMGNPRLGEVFVLDKKTMLPIIKIQGRKGSRELKVSILRKPIAGRTKTVEIELKFKCQITKFQLCTGCHACESACKQGAIKLLKQSDSDIDYKYVIDENSCVHCYECINHYTGGCYMRRVLLPRGRNYQGK